MTAQGFTHAPAAADNPLLQHLGIALAEAAAGRAVFDIELDQRHLNRQGSLQGGVAATLLDAACGYAGLADDLGRVRGHAVTVTLNVAYLRRACGGRLRATGTVTRAGRSIYFACGELATETGELIATAQGAFKRIVNVLGE
jgi:uncharacterized protein (TIGR00369 family)